MKKGCFITLEGGEGSGKSTQAPFLVEFLEKKGLPVLLTREPGGSDGAELIRALVVEGTVERWEPLTEYLLFSAARRDHLVNKIWPALEAGTWVVCDRFFDSSRVYQGAGHGLSVDALESMYRLIAGNFEPDLTFVFDLDPAIGLARTAVRKGIETRFENMAVTFHEKIRDAYLDLVRTNKNRCRLIEADKSKDQVRMDLERDLNSFYEKRMSR